MTSSLVLSVPLLIYGIALVIGAGIRALDRHSARARHRRARAELWSRVLERRR